MLEALDLLDHLGCSKSRSQFIQVDFHFAGDFRAQAQLRQTTTDLIADVLRRLNASSGLVGTHRGNAIQAPTSPRELYH